MKDCKKREVTTLHEAVAMIESIENLQSNSPALIHALGVLVYEKLRVLPIDKNAKDTIAAILPRDASAGVDEGKSGSEAHCCHFEHFKD